jgi:hypothetical protein
MLIVKGSSAGFTFTPLNSGLILINLETNIIIFLNTLLFSPINNINNATILSTLKIIINYI